jgi:hypothetical protein
VNIKTHRKINKNKGDYMKTKLLSFILTITIAAFASSVVVAGEVGSAPNPYSDCGIGAAMFTGTPWAAATSNVIWDLGSTAVTSATLSPENCKKSSFRAALFIRDTYEQLTEDIAQGEGDHLLAALEIFECKSNKFNDVKLKIREEFSNEISNSNYNNLPSLEKARNLYNIMQSSVNSACTV